MELRRIRVTRSSMRVCANGHAEPIPGTEKEVWLVECGNCLQFTGEDGNYCGWCGVKRKDTSASD